MTFRRAPFIALYNVLNFESAFSSRVSRYSTKSGTSTENNIASPTKKYLERDNSSACNSGSDSSAAGYDGISAKNQGSIRKRLQINDPGRVDVDAKRSSSSAFSDSSAEGGSSAYETDSYNAQMSDAGPISDDASSENCDTHQDDVQVSQSPIPRLLAGAKEAYLLAEAKIGGAPGVAVFCAGPMDELETLMLSALYQRSIWGIREPLVGFSWSSTGMIITTVFGWLDQEIGDDGCLVSVKLKTCR